MLRNKNLIVSSWDGSIARTQCWQRRKLVPFLRADPSKKECGSDPHPSLLYFYHTNSHVPTPTTFRTLFHQPMQRVTGKIVKMAVDRNAWKILCLGKEVKVATLRRKRRDGRDGPAPRLQLLGRSFHGRLINPRLLLCVRFLQTAEITLYAILSRTISILVIVRKL
jgi:hypothetical protein